MLSLSTIGQDMNFTKKVIADLCNPQLEGRGYVHDGVNKAATYLSLQFEDIGLASFERSYFQTYSFPINTFPYPIQCTLDEHELRIGKDFFMSPTSGGCEGTYQLVHFDLKDSIDNALYQLKIKNNRNKQEVYVLKNAEKDENYVGPIVIKSMNSKIMHSLRGVSSGLCELIFPDSVIHNASSLRIQASNLFIDSFSCKNVIGYVPAHKKRGRNKFIVFSAHYDHLGKMGDALFPGASDNASGVSMVLNLAKHFTQTRNKYNMVFILFSGEEAGLLGSEYFTTHPTFDINKIVSLVNLDILGSAENGITVVNATEFPEQFNILQSINDRKKYLSAVKSRGKTRNSDHYYFSEKGIPSFFIYSMGGPGYYHDVFDTADSLPLTKYEQVYNLLLDYVQALERKY